MSLADQDLLFSIIKSTIIDTISNMFAIADGGEIIGNYSIEIKINNEIAVHNNPNGTCNYCDKGLATLLPENATLEVIPPANASAPNKYWIDVPKTYIGNNKMPKIK